MNYTVMAYRVPVGDDSLGVATSCRGANGLDATSTARLYGAYTCVRPSR
jgi:hypothetical protein